MRAVYRAFEVHKRNDKGEAEIVYVLHKQQYRRMVSRDNVVEVYRVTFKDDVLWRLLNGKGGYIVDSVCIYKKQQQ